jgi:hypothetical protein
MQVVELTNTNNPFCFIFFAFFNKEGILYLGTTWFIICLFILFCDCESAKKHLNNNPQIEIQFGCVDSGEEIPSNISNLEVKLTCGKGSARGTWCQNSKMHPSLFIESPQK